MAPSSALMSGTRRGVKVAVTWAKPSNPANETLSCEPEYSDSFTPARRVSSTARSGVETVTVPTFVTVTAGHASPTVLGEATVATLGVGAGGAAFGLWGATQAASSMNVSSANVRFTPLQTGV